MLNFEAIWLGFKSYMARADAFRSPMEALLRCHDLSGVPRRVETVEMNTAMKYLAGAALAVSLLGAGAMASASFTDPVGSIAQVTAAVKASISTTTLSPAVSATLEEFANPSSFYLTGPSTYGNCDPYNSEALALAPKACFFGNLHGSKTIVLVGDSNAGNWVPALSIGLAKTKYRLAVFAFSGCPLANLRYNSSLNLYQRCRQWHAHVPAAIRALHPVAVLAAAGDAGSVYPTTMWANGVKSVFADSTRGSPSTTRILMGISPFFRESALTCLTAHPDPQDCSLKYTPAGAYGAALSRDRVIAKTSDATLIPTKQFFCFGNICSPVIANTLVYSDTDHVTIAYSSFISKSITAAVLAAMK
jgi:SGNH domain (fused to AT3 domains)